MNLDKLQALAHQYYELIVLFTGIGTFLAAAATFVTAVIIYWQTKVARRALQFQSYLGIEQIPEGKSVGDGVSILLYLTQYAQYQEYLETAEKGKRDEIFKVIREKLLFSCPPEYNKRFSKKEICDRVYGKFLEIEKPETQKTIYEIVSFLSTIAHLVNLGHLDLRQAWGRYFFTYRLCYKRLYPWYIYGIRKHRYEGEKIAYATFERMCVLVHEADEEAMLKDMLLKRQTEGLLRSRKRIDRQIYRFAPKWLYRNKSHSKN